MQPQRQPYRSAATPPGCDAPRKELDEDAIVHGLVFFVGAIGAGTALVDSTQTTAGALGVLALVFGGRMLVRDWCRKRPRSA